MHQMPTLRDDAFGIIIFNFFYHSARMRTFWVNVTLNKCGSERLSDLPKASYERTPT